MTPDQRARLERLVEQQAHGPLTLRDGEVMYGSDTVLDLAAALAHIDALEARVGELREDVLHHQHELFDREERANREKARAEQAKANFETLERIHDATVEAKEQAEARVAQLEAIRDDLDQQITKNDLQDATTWRKLREAEAERDRLREALEQALGVLEEFSLSLPARDRRIVEQLLRAALAPTKEEA